MKRPRIMLIVETSLAYGREVLRGINRYIIAHEPWSIYFELRELVVEPPTWLGAWKGDGVISRSTTPAFARQLRRLKIPTVNLTDIYGDVGIPYIWSDHEAHGELAATHLLERGFRNFAYCGFTGHTWSKKRQDGFVRGVSAVCNDVRAYESPWDTQQKLMWEDQHQDLCEWISKLPRPIGIMASNDLRGQHVLDACRRLEFAVPEEIAVIGVDNDELLCDFCDPPLSSVMVNSERIGYEAAALLDRLMRGEKPQQHGTLIEPMGVVTRQSTDVLAIEDPLVAAALKFIREYACNGISVEEVLQHVPLSRSILERRFRQYLGRSPQSEIRNVQLKRVKQLLLETELPLDQIAARAGYTHPEYMSVVFKRHMGETPGHFRTRSI